MIIKETMTMDIAKNKISGFLLDNIDNVLAVQVNLGMTRFTYSNFFSLKCSKQYLYVMRKSGFDFSHDVLSIEFSKIVSTGVNTNSNKLWLAYSDGTKFTILFTKMEGV